MVAIARALNNNAKLIILDEPTTALTRKEISQLFKIINKLKEEGLSIIFISHKLDEIVELCNSVVILKDGKLIDKVSVNDTSIEEIEKLMVGGAPKYSPIDNVKSDSDVILEVSNLSKRNNFRDISFSLRQGEILGVIGLLGSGRTELALSLFGANVYDDGTITVNKKKRYYKIY